MAKIFLSHSGCDEDIKNFFLQAFAGTNVKPLFEEFEQEIPTGLNARKIEADIQSSNAVFALLSENTENLKHTRDWIGWECGKATNKEIWLFEPAETMGRISLVVPTVDHYVVYQRTDEYRKIIRGLISNYDDTHVLPVLAASAASGAMINSEDRSGGAWIGTLVGLAGLAVHSIAKQRIGFPIKCIRCHSIYKIYQIGIFRCPVCNNMLEVTQQMLIDAYNNRPDSIFESLAKG